MPKIITKSATIVENGTAPDDFLPQIKKFKKKQMPNTQNG